MNGNIQKAARDSVHATGPSGDDHRQRIREDAGPERRGTLFGGMQLDQAPYLRMGLSCGMNAFGMRPWSTSAQEAPGRWAGHGDARLRPPGCPRLWTASADGDRLALNAWGEVSSSAAIPVHVNTAVTGTIPWR